MSKLSRDYLAITFLIAISCWGLCVICSINNVLLKDNPILYIPFMAGGFSPTIASYISLKRNAKIKGFKEWILSMFHFKQSLTSYLMVILFEIIIIAPKILISGYEQGAPLFAIIILIPMMIVGGGLEEAGWRLILQPEIEKKYNVTLAAILVGIIWWFWHLPLFYIQGASQYGSNFLLFGINVMGISFAMAAIMKMSGSVWLCILLHCLNNSFCEIYIAESNITASVVTFVLLIAVSCVTIHRVTRSTAN